MIGYPSSLPELRSLKNELARVAENGGASSGFFIPAMELSHRRVAFLDDLFATPRARPLRMLSSRGF